MKVLSFFKRAIPFVLALAMGIAAASLFVTKEEPVAPLNDLNEGKCFSAGHPLPCLDKPAQPVPGDSVEAPCTDTCNVKIFSKPRAVYTDAARTNNIQGFVTLRIVFLGSGQIGDVTVISGLPYGLTEQAIAAARKIRFQPATRNGKPYTKSMTIQYGFTIY